MMRIASLLLLVSCAAGSLSAQVMLRLSATGTYSTPLVKDGSLDTDLRAGVAPGVALGAFIPTGKGPYRFGVELSGERAGLSARDQTTGASTRINTVTTVHAVGLIEGTLRGALRWQVGGGSVWYSASDAEGVFQDGSSQRWVIDAGLNWQHPLNPRNRLLVQGRIERLEFTTNTLKLRGYGQAEAVERFGFGIGLEHTL